MAVESQFPGEVAVLRWWGEAAVDMAVVLAADAADMAVGATAGVIGQGELTVAAAAVLELAVVAVAAVVVAVWGLAVAGVAVAAAV